jgi:hypothetical protein
VSNARKFRGEVPAISGFRTIFGPIGPRRASILEGLVTGGGKLKKWVSLRLRWSDIISS